jgi:signal transduction protein with GAF and PtsI domain
MQFALGLSAEKLVERLGNPLHGVGLIRGEYVFRRTRAYITVERGKDALRSYLDHILTLYPDDPVWYRTSELDVEEVKVLEGCDDFEINDRILSMGVRGVRRALLHPQAFRMELQIVAEAAARHPQLGMIIPFVAEPAEAEWALLEARGAGFKGPLCTMAEIPAAVVNLDRILALGFSRTLVGLNDLTAFTMGASRGSNRYPGLPDGVRRMIEIVRHACTVAGAELAIGGALSPAHLAAAESLGVDTCVVHYEDLPKLLGGDYADLPELGRVQEIKRWTREAIRERRRQFGLTPTDPYGN